MLSKRQNLIETIQGGNPDRFVNQYEYMQLVVNPVMLDALSPVVPGGGPARSSWGYYSIFPEGMPGPMPLHDKEHILLHDIEDWREVIKAPDPHSYPDEAWKPFEEAANAIDREEYFVAAFVAPGLFETTHYFMSIDEALIAYMTNTEDMKDLVNYIADFEIECAKETIAHLHPDAVFHHDDWGSQISTFLSPDMFNEIFTEPYKRIYKFWKDNGVELIVHHSDSYAATLVPYMIEMGIDIYQGAVSDNNIPELVKKYGPQITIQGGLNNGIFDVADWSKDAMRETMQALIEAAGTKYLIPALTMGGPESTFPGVYEAVSEVVDEMSAIYFK